MRGTRLGVELGRRRESAYKKAPDLGDQSQTRPLALAGGYPPGAPPARRKRSSAVQEHSAWASKVPVAPTKNRAAQMRNKKPPIRCPVRSGARLVQLGRTAKLE